MLPDASQKTVPNTPYGVASGFFEHNRAMMAHNQEDVNVNDVMNCFRRMLLARMMAIKSCVCIGLDADASNKKVDPKLKMYCDAVTAYNIAEATVHLTHEFAACFKINQGFFACHGPLGMQMLQELIRMIQETYPGIPIILDYKREDIGNSAKQYAKEAAFYGVDAVTVGPYLGSDSVREFEAAGLFPFVLCRTSNKSAGELQDQVVMSEAEELGGMPLFMLVAETVMQWNDCGDYGLVLGATYPEDLKKVAQIAGHAIFLIPGIGKQDGALKETIEGAALATAKERPFVVNSSRGIMFADDPGEAAETLRNQITDILPVDFYN